MKCQCGHSESSHILVHGSDVPTACLKCMCKQYREETPDEDLPEVSDKDIQKAMQDLMRTASDLGS